MQDTSSVQVLVFQSGRALIRVLSSKRTILSPFTKEYRALGTHTGVSFFLECSSRSPTTNLKLHRLVRTGKGTVTTRHSRKFAHNCLTVFWHLLYHRIWDVLFSLQAFSNVEAAKRVLSNSGVRELRVILYQLPAMSIKWCCNLVFLCFFTLLAASGVAADGRVTLQALTIYNTHEWFGLKPKIYFQCSGESKVQLPDVKAKNQLYTFQGQESFQPLTTLVGIKCKRCGLYEQDSWNPDDVFGRWELCPLDFNPGPDGRYYRFKEGEFNLTLSCLSCNGTQKKLTTLSGS